jgi:tripartite-type tricarboxylate transporter receptor subunit TctC
MKPGNGIGARRRALARTLRHAAAIPLALGAALVAPVAHAAYPERAIRVVVAFPPGSGTDQMGRIVAQEITRITGQPVVIDNKPGASGVIATDIVAKAAPDGYTILLTSNTHLANKFLLRRLPYDPIADFRSVALYKKPTPLVLVVASGSPLRTLADVTAKARAGGMSYASGNSSSRVAGELYKQLIDADILYVPYKGNPDGLTDVAAGRVDMMFSDATALVPLVQAGRLRPIVSTGPDRLPNLKGVPTSTDAGLPGLNIGSWGMFLAPRGTPDDILERLNQLVVAALRTEAATRFFIDSNAEPFFGTRGDLDRFMASELQMWGSVITRAGIQPE